MRVQFGILLNVFGNPATHGGFTFVPATVELTGNGFAIGFHLRAFTGDRAPPVLRRPLEGQYDAAWVRARLPRVFHFDPESADVEKALLDVGFVAVREGNDVGDAFVCTDTYGRTGLSFSPNGPERDMQQEIATAFWSLLLEKPDELADFEQKVYHDGAGVCLCFGCRDSEPYCDEEEDED